MIYFIQDGYGNIKIGYSKNPKKRLKQLQTGSPTELKLIGTIKGNVYNEGEWHDRFKYLRKNGEWFTCSVELYEAIYKATGIYPQMNGLDNVDLVYVDRVIEKRVNVERIVKVEVEVDNYIEVPKYIDVHHHHEVEKIIKTPFKFEPSILSFAFLFVGTIVFIIMIALIQFEIAEGQVVMDIGVLGCLISAIGFGFMYSDDRYERLAKEYGVNDENEQ